VRCAALQRADGLVCACSLALCAQATHRARRVTPAALLPLARPAGVGAPLLAPRSRARRAPPPRAPAASGAPPATPLHPPHTPHAHPTRPRRTPSRLSACRPRRFLPRARAPPFSAAAALTNNTRRSTHTPPPSCPSSQRCAATDAPAATACSTSPSPSSSAAHSSSPPHTPSPLSPQCAPHKNRRTAAPLFAFAPSFLRHFPR
jgi:hypothetical protein